MEGLEDFVKCFKNSLRAGDNLKKRIDQRMLTSANRRLQHNRRQLERREKFYLLLMRRLIALIVDRLVPDTQNVDTAEEPQPSSSPHSSNNRRSRGIQARLNCQS